MLKSSLRQTLSYTYFQDRYSYMQMRAENELNKGNEEYLQHNLDEDHTG